MGGGVQAGGPGVGLGAGVGLVLGGAVGLVVGAASAMRLWGRSLAPASVWFSAPVSACGAIPRVPPRLLLKYPLRNESTDLSSTYWPHRGAGGRRHD